MLSLVVREQTLGDYGTVLNRQLSHGSGLAVATGDELIPRKARVPFGQAVEVLDGGPDLVQGRLDLYRLGNMKSLKRSRQPDACSKCSRESKNNHGCFHSLFLP